MKDLNRISTNKFTYQDVMNTFGIESYEELKVILDDWIRQELVKPIIAGGLSSFRPHVYNRYQKIRKKEDYHFAKERIVHLNPVMIGYYMAHPDEYVKEEKRITQFSEYLSSHAVQMQNPDEQMTVKERSFDIFGEEKYLERDGRKILNACGMTYADLNCCATCEPFFSHKISDEGYVIVLENKDPWDSISRVMKEKSCFLEKKISWLIYGEGNKVTSSDPSGRLSVFLENTGIHADGILYCGDLDKAGVRIFTNCRAVNPELHILPFTELYREMMKKAPVEISLLEDTDDHHTRSWDTEFLNQFNLDEQVYVREVLDHDKRIPQEILNRTDYRRMSR